MRVIIEHDFDCPLGINGLRAYSEARDAFASLPIAEYELERLQVCNCGAEEAGIGREGKMSASPIGSVEVIQSAIQRLKNDRDMLRLALKDMEHLFAIFVEEVESVSGQQNEARRVLDNARVALDFTQAATLERGFDGGR